MSEKLIEKEPCDTGFNEYYKDLDDDINNFSHWFPQIKDNGVLPVPETETIPVPPAIAQCFFMDRPNADQAAIFEWVQKSVLPIAGKVRKNSPYVFIKNGGFSDKFDARNCFCRCNEYELTAAICNINYDAICVGADGFTELVIREDLNCGEQDRFPHIYHGLPLRPEIRVFYDFGKNKVLYSANYWDWDYCHDAICRDATDKIIYEESYVRIEEAFLQNKGKAEKLVEKAMANVAGLSGQWSIDLMLMDDAFWLIDMAVAQDSAYWDPERVNK